MKRDETKALARIKRVYKSAVWWVPETEKRGNWYLIKRRRCKSITDFLKHSKYAKLLKKTSTPFRTKAMQLEQHYKNKRIRKEAKKQIEEGIEEWENQYDEYEPTCYNCEFYKEDLGPLCEKHKVFLTWDSIICKYFRD